MSGLVWERNEGYKVTSRTCCGCKRNKVKWWPTVCGWPVSDREGREGCCDLCRVVWDQVWAKGGKG